MIRLHTSRVRVYYEDTDAGGIVYHANYLRFFERARSDWLRARGVEQRVLAAATGIGFVVRDCTVRFVRPARLDDELDIDVAIEDPDRDIRRASLTLVQQARVRMTPRPCGTAPGATSDAPAPGDALQAVTARLTLAAVRLDTGRPVPLPADILQAIHPTP